MRGELLRAQGLVEDDKPARAHEIIRAVLTKYPTDQRYYEDAIAILRLAGMYSEVLRVIREFEITTGRPWAGTPTVADVEREGLARQEMERELARSAVKSWVRLTLPQRGHFSNYPALFPVRKLSISNDWIEITQRFRAPVRYRWSEVRVSLFKREAYKAYGTYARGKFVQRTCTIQTSAKVFTFDVSRNFPDFPHPDLLLAELRKHCEIEEHPLRRRRLLDWWTKFEWR